MISFLYQYIKITWDFLPKDNIRIHLFKNPTIQVNRYSHYFSYLSILIILKSTDIIIMSYILFKKTRFHD